MKLIINERTIKVEFLDENDASLHETKDGLTLGYYNCANGTLYFSKGLDPVTMRHTILHELVHTISFEYGYHHNELKPESIEEAMADFVGAHGDKLIIFADKIYKEFLNSKKKGAKNDRTNSISENQGKQGENSKLD